MGAKEEVILLDCKASMFGMRVRIALGLKGIKYEYREEDLLVGKSQLLLEMNPVHKKVPVLIHNGKSICESVIILQYIDEAWKDNEPCLLPLDPYERAQTRFWADYVGEKMYQSGRKIWTTKGETQQTSKKEFIAHLKVLEGALGAKPFFAGDTFGFVDIAMIPFYCWFNAFEICGNFSIEAECPTLIAWAKRCMQIEIVSKTLPDQQYIYEFVLKLKKKYGVE